MQKITIIRDALDFYEGGFRPGAEFYEDNFTEMLNNFSISPGTLIKKDKNLYVIVEKDGVLKLEKQNEDISNCNS